MLRGINAGDSFEGTIEDPELLMEVRAADSVFGWAHVRVPCPDNVLRGLAWHRIAG